MSLPNERERPTRNGAPGYVQIRGGRWEFHRAANGMEVVLPAATRSTVDRILRSQISRSRVGHVARSTPIVIGRPT